MCFFAYSFKLGIKTTTEGKILSIKANLIARHELINKIKESANRSLQHSETGSSNILPC